MKPKQRPWKPSKTPFEGDRHQQKVRRAHSIYKAMKGAGLHQDANKAFLEGIGWDKPLQAYREPTLDELLQCHEVAESLGDKAMCTLIAKAMTTAGRAPKKYPVDIVVWDQWKGRHVVKTVQAECGYTMNEHEYEQWNSWVNGGVTEPHQLGYRFHRPLARKVWPTCPLTRMRELELERLVRKGSVITAEQLKPWR